MAMRRRFGILALVVTSPVLGAKAASAQSGYLQPGDVAVTCVETSLVRSLNNRIQITPLVELPSLSALVYQIQYTDLEADADGVFYDFDELQSDIPIDGPKHAGEPIMYVGSGLMGPDEQVFLFQGVLNEESGMVSPPLLWGFQMSSAGGWATTRMDDVSELPRSIAQASVAVKTSGNDAFAYTGPTTGTRAGLQAAIADPANWTGGGTCPTGFTVIAAADGGTDGSDGGDAAVDTEFTDSSDAAIVDTHTGVGGSGGVTGSGDGGPDGVGGAGGAGGAGGIDGAGGAGQGAAGADGGSGVGGMVTLAGVGGAPAADGSIEAAGGADASIDPGDARADADAVLIRDAAGDVTKQRAEEAGCGCAVGGGFADSLAGIGVLALSLVLVRRRRRAIEVRATTGRRWGSRVGRGA